MAPTARLPPKKDVALALLEQASMFIHLDPRAEGVQVPVWFKKQPQLVLQVGLNMAVPIPDLHVDDNGLSCTLSFNRSPFFCSIPWRAVFALVGEKNQAMVWAEDVPAEVAAQAQAQKQPERPRPHLRPVGDDESAPAPQAAAEEKPAAEEAKKPATKKGSRVSKAEGAEPKRASKGGAKGKAAAKRGDAEKPVAAKKPTAAKSEKKPEAEAAAAKPAARPQAALAAKETDKPAATQSASDSSKPKRELPPYLRVVK